MAVEARHLSLFSPQLITNRDVLLNWNEGNAGIYNTQMGYGVPFTGTMPETLLPFHQSLVCDSVLPVKASLKADSSVTYNVPAAPRKRYRDSLNQTSTSTVPQQNHHLSEWSSSFIGEDIPLQQSEIDLIVAEHTKKIKLEIEERQNQHARLLVSTIGEGIMKKMKEKDDQIQGMGKLNWILQERVKSLYVENQLWRDLAQTNEATANSLRSNLEQVLAHVSDEQFSGGGGGGGASATDDDDDAESCCDSSDHGRDKEEEDEMLALEGKEIKKKLLKDKEVAGGGGGVGNGGNFRNRMCRNCGERESWVLLLPCRHLCLCTLCGSTLLPTCPVCNSCLNASVHVNMS